MAAEEVRPILHVSQIASVLGLPRPPGGENVQLGWELVSALDEWLQCVRSLGWEALTAPTASRGRSLRNLTVNVFHPVGLLPIAWTTGRFDWDPDGDAEREAALGNADEIASYAEHIAAGWTSFLLDSETDLHERDPEVRSPRGPVTYSELMASQVWHAQFHLRQITSESLSA